MWRIFHTFAIITDIVDLQLYCYMKNLRYLVLACAVLTGVSMTSLTNKTSSRRLIVPIAFYNLENLFDTIHDVLMDTINGVPVKIADKNDYEYLPDGTNHWNTMKYNAKLKNMSYALSQFAIDVNERGPAVIGVSEVENRRVLEDLVQQPALKERGYKVIHEEGPDRRGVDCAFIYNPRMFRYDHHKLVPYVYPNNDTTHATRGFLVASGKILREDVSLIVCHWPSRFSTGFYRGLGGRQVRAIKDSLLKDNPNEKIIIMGDMNDDPDDRSMAEALGAKRERDDCGPHDLWNPWWNTLRRRGIGTLKYNGIWNLFDQIVFTGNMIDKERKYESLSYLRHEVFNRDFLIQQEGQYKGNPLRTHGGGVWLNGYSDHFPTIVYFAKEVPDRPDRPAQPTN